MHLGTLQRWLAPGSPEDASQDAEGRRQHQPDNRRELLRIALRDVLVEHGVPTGWVTSEILRTKHPDGPKPWHLRLVLHEWHPEFLPYLVGFEKEILARLRRIDVDSEAWFAGLSWRFELQDDRQCPQLPKSGRWQEGAAGAPSLRRCAPAIDEPTSAGAIALRAPPPPTEFPPTISIPLR